MKSKLLDTYNEKGSLLVIGGYPKRNQKYGPQTSGVFSFTKNTLHSIQDKNPYRKIVVLTIVVDNEEIYEEDNMLIIRVLKRNDLLSYFTLIKYLWRFNKIKQVLLEFGLAAFGGMIMTTLLIPVVFSIFLMGKSITLVVHEYLRDLRKLSGHIGISEKNPLLPVLNVGLSLFYLLLSIPVKNIIVLEEELKRKLGRLIGDQKITVIPHGVDAVKNVDMNLAREKLEINQNDFVVLYFGYLTWYKGVDWLIETLRDVKFINGRKLRVLIAGGPSFTQGQKTHYKNFLKHVEEAAKSAKNITLTGFVPEKNIGSVFAASDLMIFPYRVLMSSSGPLSLALSYKKPFVLSSNLEGIANSDDFKQAMDISQLKKGELFFSLEKNQLLNKIKLGMDKEFKNKMLILSEILTNRRSFPNLASFYDKILSGKEEPAIIYEPSIAS